MTLSRTPTARASTTTFGRTLRRLLATLVAVAGLGMVASSSASAIVAINYCGVLVNANSACWHYATGSFITNTARYQGSGNVGVCERVDSPPVNISRRCDNRIVGSSTDLNGWYGYFMEARVGNDSNYRHTIHGQALAP